MFVEASVSHTISSHSSIQSLMEDPPVSALIRDIFDSDDAKCTAAFYDGGKLFNHVSQMKCEWDGAVVKCECVCACVRVCV